MLGAGTVLDPETARAALLAGAEFIVSPSLNPDVIRLCNRYDKLVMPGAFTPTEILAAWEAGADIVKVFPSDAVGPSYLKALKGPFPQIRLMPTGGVNLQTLPEFIKAGALRRRRRQLAGGTAGDPRREVRPSPRFGRTVPAGLESGSRGGKLASSSDRVAATRRKNLSQISHLLLSIPVARSLQVLRSLRSIRKMGRPASGQAFVIPGWEERTDREASKDRADATGLDLVGGACVAGGGTNPLSRRRGRESRLHQQGAVSHPIPVGRGRDAANRCTRGAALRLDRSRHAVADGRQGGASGRSLRLSWRRPTASIGSRSARSTLSIDSIRRATTSSRA